MNDLINGFFQFGSGLFVLNNCYTLYKDKMVKGVSAFSTAFFTLFGFWNLYYFAKLGQDVSFYAGLILVCSNVLWLSLMIHYKGREDV